MPQPVFCATVIIFVVEVPNVVAVTDVAAAAVAAVVAVAVIVEVHQEMSQKWGLNVNSVSVEKRSLQQKKKWQISLLGVRARSIVQLRPGMTISFCLQQNRVLVTSDEAVVSSLVPSQKKLWQVMVVVVIQIVKHSKTIPMG